MRKPVLSIQIVYMYKVTSVVLPCRSTWACIQVLSLFLNDGLRTKLCILLLTPFQDSVWRGWPCGSDALTIHGAKVSALTWFVVILPAFRLYGLGVHHTFHRNLEPSIIDTTGYCGVLDSEAPSNSSQRYFPLYWYNGHRLWQSTCYHLSRRILELNVWSASSEMLLSFEACCFSFFYCLHRLYLLVNFLKPSWLATSKFVLSNLQFKFKDLHSVLSF